MSVCLNPLLMRNRQGEVVKVPCGHCINCKKERSKAWAFRIVCESQKYKNAVYLTLTYEDSNLLLVPDSFPYYATLEPRDLQLFIKRLRKNLGGRKIKYYACGEYGGKTYRPHYHLIVFNVDFDDSEIILKSWSKGFVKVDPVNVATISYVAGYVQKKLYSKDSYPDLICKPFSRMSKKLGFDYFKDNFEDIWNNGITFQGYRLKVPRYFYRLIEEEKIGDKKLYELMIKKNEMKEKAVLDNNLKLSRRFGYLEDSDDKRRFELIQERSNRAGAIARQLLDESRSKI